MVLRNCEVAIELCLGQNVLVFFSNISIIKFNPLYMNENVIIISYTSKYELCEVKSIQHFSSLCCWLCNLMSV